MKFNVGDRVATTTRGTALLKSKGEAVGVVTEATPAGAFGNWIMDQDEFYVKFEGDALPSGEPLAMAMKASELKLVIAQEEA